MVHATTRAQSAMISHNREPPSLFESSSLNRVDEETNQFTSNESILINKVNEMQTKTASFGY